MEKPVIKKLIKNEYELYGFLAVISVFCLITANIIAYKQADFGIIVLTCSTFIFPISYIVDDVLAECYGFWNARKVIYLGFFLDLLFVIYAQLSIMAPYPPFFTGQEHFASVLGFTPLLLLGSFTAYIVGSIVNAGIVAYMKKHKMIDDSLFARLIGSTVVGQTLDAVIFVGIAFGMTTPFADVCFMIISISVVKILVEVVLYPITKRVVNYIKKEYNIN